MPVGISVREEGSFTLSSEEQPLKRKAPMSVTASGIVTDLSEVQSRKTYDPSVLSDSGRTISSSDLQE